MRRSLLTLLFCLLTLVLGTGIAQAHALGQSYIYLKIYDDRIEGHLEIALGEVNALLGSQLPLDMGAKEKDVEELAPQLLALARENFHAAAEGQALPLELKSPRLYNLPIAQYAVLDFTIPGSPPQGLELENRLIELLDAEHVCHVLVWENWKTSTFNNEAGISLTLSRERPVQVLDLGDDSVLQGFLGMVTLGMKRFVFGFDHVLFLIALLLPTAMTRREPDDQWEPVETFREFAWNLAKLFTAFTLAHGLTLCLATLGLVSLNSRFVESLIALSVIVAALDILRPLFRSKLWLMVLFFGLFHGFGFASMLGEMNIPSKYLGLSLLGFQLGIGLGQLCVIGFFLPILYLNRTSKFYRALCLRAVPGLLILIACYWFVERAFGVDLPLGSLIYMITGFRLD